jgi:transposase
MPASPRGDGFVESTEMPRGRKARAIPEIVWQKLEESARRSIAFTKSGDPASIEELKKDLGAASVKAKYEVTVETKRVSDKVHELKFSAKHRAQVAAEQEAEAQAEPEADADAKAEAEPEPANA